MHHGVLHQTGTPADLKQSISSQRLELRTPDLAIAEQLLNGEARETVDIKDVQRFGDRLDVLVADSVVSRLAIETLFRSKGMAISDIQVGQPTLENTFVATLRALGEDTRSEAFPGDHDHQDAVRNTRSHRRPDATRRGDWQPALAGCPPATRVHVPEILAV